MSDKGSEAEKHRVCWLKGTEQPFSGEYVDCKDAGVYHCACCARPLFSSETKFDSGTGWPSFWDAYGVDSVKLVEDRTHGMLRVEVLCAGCGAHLGHIFDDGPAPTNQRYCMNSVALKLERTPVATKAGK